MARPKVTTNPTTNTPKKGANGRPPKTASRNQAEELGIGERLTRVREAAGLSQRELARRAGVTNATVSLLEQEAHAPSLASLHRILSAIPISLADFFSLPATQQNAVFYQAEDLAVLTRGDADLRVLGAERRDKKLQMFVERYKPGAGTGAEPVSHEGETAAVIIRGTVEVVTGGKKYILTAGGGYQLFSRQPYTLRNVGDTTAVVVCACTPAMI